MLLNQTVFEAEVAFENSLTVYVGIMEEGWNLGFEDLEYYDYIRFFNSAFEALDSDNQEGETFRSALPMEFRREIYSLCIPHIKEVLSHDLTPLKKGEWHNGQWQKISS